MTNNKINTTPENAKDQSTLLIGIFLGIFGIAVLFALFFTDSYRGRVVNIICGGLFILIGLGAIAAYNYQPKKKRLKKI